MEALEALGLAKEAGDPAKIAAAQKAYGRDPGRARQEGRRDAGGSRAGLVVP
jgi:hypothetical protein